MKVILRLSILNLLFTACNLGSGQGQNYISVSDVPTPSVVPSSTPTPAPTLSAGPSSIPTPAPTRGPVTIEGIVADCRYPYGDLIGIPYASVRLDDFVTITDDQGRFSFVLPQPQVDAYLDISAEGYIPYSERPSRMVNGAFHLIPEDLYRGVYLVLWNPERSNPNNWHRKWETQTLFVIVQKGASESQINTLLQVLSTDRYRDMTGGRFTSGIAPTIVDTEPSTTERRGKTVISFKPNIISGGIAHSEDDRGIIYYAEITWNINQQLDANMIWHEIVHTITAGGHINEWPSVVSEVRSLGGDLSSTDIEIFNCMYNSPPMRAQPMNEP